MPADSGHFSTLRAPDGELSFNIKNPLHSLKSCAKGECLAVPPCFVCHTAYLFDPLTEIIRDCLLIRSAARLQSYLPLPRPEDISQPMNVPLCQRYEAYSSSSLPFYYAQ